MFEAADIREWRGHDVVDDAGRKVGTLESVYVDTGTDQPAFATVTVGLPTRHRLVFVPLDGATVGPGLPEGHPLEEPGRGAPSIGTDGELPAERGGGHLRALQTGLPARRGRRAATRPALTETGEAAMALFLLFIIVAIALGYRGGGGQGPVLAADHRGGADSRWTSSCWASGSGAGETAVTRWRTGAWSSAEAGGEHGGTRAEAQGGRLLQVGGGVHVRAQAGHVGQQDLHRAAGPVPAAEPGPNRGRNGVPGRAAYSVVPVPAASATNASGQLAAARRPRASSAGRSAGRSAASPAVPDLGQRAAATDAPWARAGLSPAAGSSGTITGAQLTQRAGGGRVVGHHEHGGHRRAGGRGADRVRRHGQRQRRPGGPGQAGQPGFGAGKYLDGDHQRPAERAVGHTGDHTVPAAMCLDRCCAGSWPCLDTATGGTGDWHAMRSLMSAGDPESGQDR